MSLFVKSRIAQRAAFRLQYLAAFHRAPVPGLLLLAAFPRAYSSIYLGRLTSPKSAIARTAVSLFHSAHLHKRFLALNSTAIRLYSSKYSPDVKSKSKEALFLRNWLVFMGLLIALGVWIGRRYAKMHHERLETPRWRRFSWLTGSKAE